MDTRQYSLRGRREDKQKRDAGDNLHLLASDAKPGAKLADGVVFDYGDASEYGFLALTVSGGKISGEYTGVAPGTMPDGSDAKVTPAKDAF
jgi:hypothetical protein